MQFNVTNEKDDGNEIRYRTTHNRKFDEKIDGQHAAQN